MAGLPLPWYVDMLQTNLRPLLPAGTAPFRNSTSVFRALRMINGFKSTSNFSSSILCQNGNLKLTPSLPTRNQTAPGPH